MNVPSALLRLVVACGGALCPAGLSAAPSVEPQAAVPAGLCKLNRVVVAPGAAKAVIWYDDGLKMAGSPLRRQPNAFILLPLGEEKAGPEPRIFSTDRSLSAFRWSRDGQALEALVERVGLLRLRASEPPIVRDRALSNLWGPIRVVSQSHGNLEDQLRAYTQSLRALPWSNQHRFKTAILDADVTLVAADARSLFSLMVMTPEGPSPTGLSSFSVYDLAKVDAKRLAFAGSEIPVPGATAPPFPHRRPFFDLETGQAIGFYTPTSVADLAGRPVAGPGPLGFVKHVSASGGTIAILEAEANGRHWLAVRKGGKMRRHLLCGSGPQSREAASSGAAAHGRAGVEQVLFGRPGSAAGFAGYLINGGAAGAKSLIVRFHGGPLATMIDGFPANSTRQLAATGHDLLELDAAGAIAIGPGAESALRRSGPKALERSARSVMKWAADRGYDRVHVVGESFGGAQAAFAAYNFPKLVRTAILVAPLSSFDPGRSIAGQENPLPLQTAFELTAIGDAGNRVRLQDWLRGIFARSCQVSRLRVYVGDRDRVTSADRLPPCLRANDTVTMRVVKGDHSDVFEAQEVWDDVRGILTQAAAPAKDVR